MDQILKIKLGREVKDYLSITFGLICYALGWAASTTVTGIILPSSAKIWVMPTFFPIMTFCVMVTPLFPFVGAGFPTLLACI